MGRQCPQSMLRLLKRCLRRIRRRRLRDIGDVWELLDVDVPGAPRSRAGTAGWIAAAVARLPRAVALWAPWRGAERPADRPLVKLEIDLGPDVTLPPLVIPTPSSVAISPDGRHLAYFASVSGGTTRLFTRALDQPQATEVAGTEGATNPSFSPDGQWVLFFDGNRVKKVSVGGGAVVPLIDVAPFGGAAWLDDRTLLVGSGVKQGLLRTSADGGTSLTNSRTGGQRDVYHDAVDAARRHRRADFRVPRAAQFGHGVHRRLIAG